MNTVMNTNLSDTQLAILAHAAAREDLLVLPTPKSLKARGGALNVVLNSLLDRGLVEEFVVERGETQEWRRDDDGRRLALKLSDGGLTALGLGSDDVSEAEAEADAKAAAERRPAIESEVPAIVGNDGGPASAASPTGANLPANGSGPEGPGQGLRAGSKGAQVLALLKRDEGASIEEMMLASGWQAHSVRGFLSGALKKKQGLEVTSDKDAAGQRRYRVA